MNDCADHDSGGNHLFLHDAGLAFGISSIEVRLDAPDVMVVREPARTRIRAQQLGLPIGDVEGVPERDTTHERMAGL